MEANLLSLKKEEEGIISKVTHPDNGMKRRLLDLGFYENTPIKRVLESPKGDPIAYKVRGTTIALRNSDAQYIILKGENDEDRERSK